MAGVPRRTGAPHPTARSLGVRRGGRRPAAARQALGFTLLELIIVVAIFAVFSLMAYGGLDSVLNTRRDVELAQDRLAELQRVYVRLREDLQQVRFRPARDGFGDVQPALRADDRGYVEFTRAGWRNPLYLPRSGLERVAYRYEDGKLIRTSWRVLDRAQDSAPVEIVLLDQLDDVRWQYVDTRRERHTRWPPDSVDVPAAEQPPPVAAEIVIRTKDIGELRYLFRLGSDNPVIPRQFNAEGQPTFGGGRGTEDGGDTNGGSQTPTPAPPRPPPPSFDPGIDNPPTATPPPADPDGVTFGP